MSPLRAAALHAAFQRLLEDHASLIDHVLTGHLRAAGEQALLDARQDVAMRLWHVYPEKYDEELAHLAAGLPSPHDWPHYIARTASNVGKDAAADSLEHRTHSESLDRRRDRRLPTNLPEDAEPYPLTEADRWIDPAAVDPAAAAVVADMARTIARALKKMSPDERNAAIDRLEEWRDTEAAKARSLTVSTARRRRLAAQSILAEALTAAGYAPHGKSSTR